MATTPFWLDMRAVMIDVVVVIMLIWITSGLIMWWEPKKARRWGWVALSAGAAMFTAFLVGL